MKIKFKFDPTGAMGCFRDYGVVFFYDACRRELFTKKDVSALTEKKALDFYNEQSARAKFFASLRADLGEAKLDDWASWCGASDHSGEYKRYTAEIAKCRRLMRWAEDEARDYYKWSHPGRYWEGLKWAWQLS